MYNLIVGKIPQKKRAFYAESSNITNIISLNNDIFYISDSRLYSIDKNSCCKLIDEGKIKSLSASKNMIFYSKDNIIYEFNGEKISKFYEHNTYIEKIVFSNDFLIIKDKNNTIYIVEQDKPRKLIEIQEKVFDFKVDKDENIWIGTDNGLLCVKNGNIVNYKKDNSGLLGDSARALELDNNGYLWIGTNKGLNIFDRYEEWEAFTGHDGLPYDNITSLKLSENGDVWIGTTWGAIRLRKGSWSYFASKRWLPNDYVNDIETVNDDAWIATRGGISHIFEVYMTLEEKAKIYEEKIKKYHFRRGFINAIVLEKPGCLEKWHHRIADNDGLWTSIYVATESFRYAATKDPEAKQNAIKSFLALEQLVKVTGIKGFPARAIAKKGEDRGSGGEWHDFNNGKWEWKGDTSSDEIDGHIFAYTVFWQLIDDEEYRKRAAKLVDEIVEHILDNNFYLVDIDGKPTTWGVWNPEKLNKDPIWWMEHGLNALEILAYLKAAYVMTGKKKYEEAYRMLVEKYHYAINTIRQKITTPGFINHSDDELAFLAYYVLLTFEKDPELRRIYLLSLERSWQFERPERNPLWNFIYGALTGKPCDIEASVQTLIEIPLDLIEWTIVNSHRKDIIINEALTRSGEKQSVNLLPYDERRIMRWNGNPFVLDSYAGGREMLDGSHWLLPYWMGRYFGFIKEKE